MSPKEFDPEKGPKEVIYHNRRLEKGSQQFQPQVLRSPAGIVNDQLGRFRVPPIFGTRFIPK